MLVFIWKSVSPYGIFIRLWPISLAVATKEAIGSSIETSCFFFGLGFGRGFYKIKNTCIKLDVIYKYKLNEIVIGGSSIIRIRCLGQATNVWNVSDTVIISSEGRGTWASTTRSLSTVTFTTSGERGTLCKVVAFW